MSRHGIRVRLISACILAVTGTLLHGQTASLSPTSMSFGNQAVGTTSAAKSVKFTNTSATPLVINSIMPSLPAPAFTVTSNCPGSLTQNASCTITATFGPTATGSASETVSISDNATNSPQRISLSGTGVVPASVSPASLSFGNVALGFNKTMTVTLTNNLPVALSLSGPVASGDYAVNNAGVTGACGLSLAAGGHCSIGVTFTPTQLGSRTGSLTITDAATNSPQVVSLSGSGATPASASPASLSFGNVGLGVNSTTSVTLTNNLTTPISIGTPAATGDFAVNTGVSGHCGSTLAGGAHCSIGVTFSPTQLGARTGTLTITDSASNSPQTVPLTGTGSTSSLTSITVTPSLPTIIQKSTLQFTAIANFPGAITLNVTTSSTWSSSATTIATITGQGLATSIKAGTATIKATYAGKSGSTTVTVTIPVKPLITWTTPAPITYGTSLSSAQLDAMASVNGVPIAGTYMYYPPAGDTPSFTPDGINLSVQFTPSDTVHYLPASASVVLVVNRATVQVLLSNMTVPYTGAPQSPTVTTSIGNIPYVITFNGAGPWPVNVGSSQVLATVNWTNYQGSASGTFTITKASPVFSNLLSQTIVAGASSINVSGTIAAGSAIPAGEQVIISINGVAMPATIAPNGAFSAALNTSSIPASNTPYPITYSYAGDSSFNPAGDATTSLTVNAAPTLVSIALSPQNPVTGLGGTPQLTATGTYSDKSTKELTNTATWTFAPNSPASSAAVMSVTGGLATAASTGCGGPVTMTATSGSVSASTTLMVGIPEGFACGANTTDARDGHTATLMNNGLILIAGGLGSGGAPPGSAELYDPVANTSTYTGSLNIPRSNHTATLLNNGKVLIAGGVDSGGNPLASVEIYDPFSGTFTQLSDAASLAMARFNHRATLLNDGTVAIIGGTGVGGDVAAIEVFDPSLGGFYSVGGLATARTSHTATLLSTGDVLVAGGNSGGVATNSAEIVTVSLSGVSTSSISMTSARAFHTATALSSGLVLLAGGIDGTGTVSNSSETYDPSAGAFTALTATMACRRANHTATELTNNTVLLAGGCFDPSNSAEVFDPGSSAFTATTLQLNTPRTFHTASLVHCACPEDGWVLLADGVDSGANVLNTTEWYQPASLIPAGLADIQVSPGAPTIPMGTTLQFTAAGTIGSNSQPLNAVSWTSSNPAVVTISNDASNSGIAVPAGAGQATVTACAGTVCGSATVTVQ